MLRRLEFLGIIRRLADANFRSLISFNEIKTVRIKSSFAELSFIPSGKRKSESESESTEVTSGTSTDEGEKKETKEREKAGKSQGQEKGKKGKGMNHEMLTLHIIS